MGDAAGVGPVVVSFDGIESSATRALTLSASNSDRPGERAGDRGGELCPGGSVALLVDVDVDTLGI